MTEPEVHKKITLFDFQKDTVRSIEKHNGRSLLALEMGLGKTLCSLACLRRNPEWLPALVVTPASVKYNWQYEAKHYMKLESGVCEGRNPAINKKGITPEIPLTIINYDILKFWLPRLKKMKFNTVIFDEVQFISNPRSARSRAAHIIAKPAKHVLALSGTPLMNRPSELWHTLNILWPDKYPTFWAYAHSHCNPKYTRWGWDYSGASKLGQLHNNLLELGMVRKLKKDVLKDLPPKFRRIIPCDITDRDQYTEASTDFLSWIKKHKAGKLEAVSKAEQITQIGYLLRLVAELKMDAVIEWATQFLEETDEKLILFGVHRATLDTLEERLKKYKSVRIDGSTPALKRKLLVDQFQKDKPTRLFIGNIQAAGVGITLTAASEVGFVEMWWKPAAHTQAEDRASRIGQDKPVFINYLVAGDTIEEKLCHVLQEKQEIISTVLDGNPASNNLNVYDELLKTLIEKAK